MLGMVLLVFVIFSVITHDRASFMLVEKLVEGLGKSDSAK